MWDSLYKKMSSFENLQLAWARLKTSQNIYYKNHYRNLLLAYELNSDENLRQLSDRLRSGSYETSSILRFYIPKQSGLHRPITFLHLDDLIVYQAIANIIAEKFWDKRLEIQNVTTFSNVLNKSGKRSIFLFQRWQEGYRSYIKKIKDYYLKGNTWVAHFDLAAYYDTIDLQTLSKQISERSYEQFTKFIIDCISRWTTHKSKKLYHGIPQGPIASNLIGDIYLLPIDQKLKKKEIKYVRYVDDIKIFGKNKKEVQEGIIILEQECKERGLIPHAKKYEIINAKNVDEAIGKYPSLQQDEKKVIFKDQEEAYRLFTKAFDPASFDVSKVRYVLKTSGENKGILNTILNNLDLHPELTDEFCVFLLNYRHSEEIAVKIYNKIIFKPVVYSYVEGMYWQLLAEFKISKARKKKYAAEAMKRIRQNREEFSLKLGLYKYLCSLGTESVLKWLRYESSCLIQMMVFPYISVDLYKTESFKKLIQCLFSRSNYDAPLVATKEIVFNSEDHLLAGITYKDETGVLANTLGHVYEFDPIETILKKTYVLKFKKWKKYLKKDYKQANNLIYLAYKTHFIDRNAWINYTDGFLDIIVRTAIDLLKSKGVSGLPETVEKGKLVDFGKLLNNKGLDAKIPGVMPSLLKVHRRRSSAPSSHAFDKKLKRTKPVKQSEQKNLVALINGSLHNLLTQVERYL